MDNRTNIKETIVKLNSDKGRTLGQLAAGMDKSISTVSLILKNGNPSLITILDMLNQLDAKLVIVDSKKRKIELLKHV